jgi:hypothetical protein
MTAFDQFFAAAREAFANPDVDWVQLGLIVALAALVTTLSSRWLGRRRLRLRLASEIDAVVAATGLQPADLDYLNQIADAAGLPVLEVMTSLAPFEHATAATLAAERAAPLRPEADSAFDRVGRLRKTLGFAPLPPHAWLLSTRELVLGDRVSMGRTAGQVVEVNEASFAVDLPAEAALAPNSAVGLAIDRPDDSPYLARVQVRAVEAPPQTEAGSGTGPLAIRRTFFTHDEQPERHQHRKYVRARVHDAVMVRMARAPAAATMAGTLVDASAGGLSMDLPLESDGPLEQGARIRCSFTLGPGEVFEEVEALVVAAAAGPQADLQHLRVAFTSIAESERDRLAAAVTKLQGPARDLP